MLILLMCDLFVISLEEALWPGSRYAVLQHKEWKTEVIHASLSHFSCNNIILIETTPSYYDFMPQRAP